MQKQKDEFDGPEGDGIIASVMGIIDGARAFRERSRIFSFLPLLGLAALVGAVLVYSYPREAAHDEGRPVPIVRADATPVRVTPEEEGGMAIPHKDSTVFETLRTADGKGAVENLLPPPEQPVDRSKVFAAAKTEINQMATTAQAGAPVMIEVPQPEQVAEMEKPVETKLPTSPPRPLPTTEIASKAAATEPASGVVSAAKSVKKATGDFYVQVGSVKGKSEAQKGWLSYQAKFPAQLGALDLRIQEANLGAKGVFYRLQGGPLSESEARAICQEIVKKTPGGCLAVRK